MSHAYSGQPRRISRKERNKWRKLVSQKEILPEWHAKVPPDCRAWTPPPQIDPTEWAEACRADALALIASLEGQKRRGFARREVVEALTSKEAVKGLEDDGLIAEWDLGVAPRVTPWGYLSGRLLILTPLGAKARDVEIIERTERAVVAEVVKSKRQKGTKKKLRETWVLMANSEVPFWKKVQRDEKGRIVEPKRKRRRPRDHASDNWLKLIEDYRAPASGA